MERENFFCEQQIELILTFLNICVDVPLTMSIALSKLVQLLLGSSSLALLHRSMNSTTDFSDS